jgi:hypothetical protein
LSTDQKIEGRLDAALRQAGSSLGHISTARNDQEVFRSAWESEDAARRIAPEPVRQRAFVSTAPAVEPRPAPVPEPQIEERGVPARLDERAARPSSRRSLSNSFDGHLRRSSKRRPLAI